MIDTPSTRDRIQRALSCPSEGVVGAVDELLAIAAEHSLRLERQADGCRVRLLDSGTSDFVDVQIRSSVFRAILARISVLCNQQHSDCISPYGGQGKLAVGSNPATTLHVSFVNTPAEQSIDLLRAGQPTGTNCEQVKPSLPLAGCGGSAFLTRFSAPFWKRVVASAFSAHKPF
jgi:hypothetical protein